MRVVVTGATGNVGTSVISALAGDPRVGSITGIARRVPAPGHLGVEWAAADVTRTDLEPLLRGADVVIHLAWLIQPSHDPAAMRRVNVGGSERVFRAASAAGVRRVVHASSVGVYSKGPKDRRVAEDWPREGISTSAYSRDKAAAERLLDRLERDVPDLEIVRLRPGLIFKRSAASEVRRYFIGPLLPNGLVRDALIPFVPDIERLLFQAIHSDDVGQAYRLAAIEPSASGAYNIAAEPPVGTAELARLVGARPVRSPRAVVRAAAQLTWRLHLQPTDGSWIDLALDSPLMDVTRAESQLGFVASRSSLGALRELVDGLREAAGGSTPPVRSDAGGLLRIRELLSGIGKRSK